MLHNTFCRRLAALVLTLAVALSAVLPVFAVYPMPVQTATETEAVYLFNADTGKTILSQNADQQKYVASLTKLMTALLLVESGKDLNGEVTVPTDLTQEFKDIQNANGTTIGLRIGETVRRIDLLNAMLIVSANDAASVIAWDVGGSVVGFVQQMNARAAELGCTGTNFTCAHGLFDYGNVSTAQDLAKIAAACAENQTFAQVAGTASYVLPATNLRKAEYTISSSNSLMNSESSNYREYVQWVKGGFTTLAGRCIVAFAQQDGHNYGLVILGCDTLDHLFTACDDLFDWAFASFADRPLVDTQTVLTTVDLTKCRTEPAVELYAAAPVSGYGHSDDKVSYSFDLPERVSATVKEGPTCRWWKPPTAMCSTWCSAMSLARRSILTPQLSTPIWSTTVTIIYMWYMPRVATAANGHAASRASWSLTYRCISRSCAMRICRNASAWLCSMWHSKATRRSA